MLFEENSSKAVSRNVILVASVCTGFFLLPANSIPLLPKTEEKLPPLTKDSLPSLKKQVNESKLFDHDEGE